MRPVITPAESARLDEASSEPVEVLMDRAGYGVALEAAGMGIGYGSRVVALAGPGNNGGDVYVAARYLRRRGADVEVQALGFPKGEWSASRKAAAAAVHAGVRVRPLGTPFGADLIIDGLFGAGFHGSLRGEAAAWAEAGGRVLAIDLPSGLNGTDGSVEGPVFTAERTVTFHALKTGHLLGQGPDRCGAVAVVDIGLGDEEPALWLCDDDDAPVPARSRTSHKWSSGAVLVVGGSPGLAGAAVLTGRAALEAGAGYVRVASHPEVAPLVAGADPSLTTMAWHVDDVLGDADRFDVLVLGPGMGRSAEAREIVATLLERWPKALVLDADGITLADPAALSGAKAHLVLTPHAGEFHRLMGEEAGLDAVVGLAEGIGGVVVMKGNPTIVAGTERWAVTSGGPELATLGTGDVLAGMIGAFAARGLDPETAARSAAHRHGRAGAALAARETVTASKLLGEIGRWSW
jgi:NAD(P)H-hydrate epimerase